MSSTSCFRVFSSFLALASIGCSSQISINHSDKSSYLTSRLIRNNEIQFLATSSLKVTSIDWSTDQIPVHSMIESGIRNVLVELNYQTNAPKYHGSLEYEVELVVQFHEGFCYTPWVGPGLVSNEREEFHRCWASVEREIGPMTSPYDVEAMCGAPPALPEVLIIESIFCGHK